MRIHFIDSLQPNQEVPVILEQLLRYGFEYTFNAGREDITHRIPGYFKDAEFIHHPDIPQQEGGADCGWWAVYNATMFVVTGKSDFLAQFQKRSRNPAAGFRNIFSGMARDYGLRKKYSGPSEEELSSIKIAFAQTKNQDIKTNKNKASPAPEQETPVILLGPVPYSTKNLEIEQAVAILAKIIEARPDKEIITGALQNYLAPDELDQDSHVKYLNKIKHRIISADIKLNIEFQIILGSTLYSKYIVNSFIDNIKSRLDNEIINSNGVLISVYDVMFKKRELIGFHEVIHDLNLKFHSGAQSLAYHHYLAPFSAHNTIQKHLLLSYPKFTKVFFENGIYSLDKFIENDQAALELQQKNTIDGKRFSEILLNLLNHNKDFTRYLTLPQINSITAEINKQSKNPSIIITKANKDAIFQALIIDNILTVGRRYIDTEERDFRMQCISDQDILIQIITAIEYIQKKTLPDQQEELLGFIGAASHEIHKRGNKSQLAKQNPGVPWRAISFAHRIIMHKLFRPHKYLMHSVFSEGIYYDEELHKQAKVKIILEDIPQLKQAITGIIRFSFFRQTMPIAITFNKLYQFYYEECQLQFLRYASKEFLHNFLEFYDEELAPSNIFKDGTFYQIAYLPLIMCIGESLKFLSPNLQKQFNRKLVTSFTDARDVISHPERKKNKDTIDQIRDGKMTIFDLLNMDNNTLKAGLKHLNQSAENLLKEIYGYSFNVPATSLGKLATPSRNKKKTQVKLHTLPMHIQRIFTAADNFMHLEPDSTFKEFKVAFEPRRPSRILDRENNRTKEEYLGACIKQLKTNNPQYHSFIDFLHLNQSYYLGLKAQKKCTQDEQSKVETFEKIEALVRGRVQGNQGHGFIKLYYLYIFQDQYSQNRQQKNPDAKQIEFIARYKSVWQNLSNYLCGNKAKENTKENLQDLCTGFTRLFEDFYNSKNSYAVKGDESGYKAFAKEYLAIQAVSRGNQKPINSDDKRLDKFIQHTINKSKEALSTLDAMNSIHTMCIASRESVTKFRSLLTNSRWHQLPQFLSSISSYFEITLGSLARALEDNHAVQSFTSTRFIEFFKTHFQNPRGHIAHNQIADIGNKEYIEMLEVQKSRSKPVFTITGTVRNVQNGQLSILPHYVHPSVMLEKDFLERSETLKEGTASLYFNSKSGELLHCYIVISRDKNSKPIVNAYLVEQTVADNDPDPDEIKRNSRFCITLNKESYQNRLSEYINKPLRYILHNHPLSKNIIFDVIEFFDKNCPFSTMQTTITFPCIMVMDTKTDIVLSREEKAAVTIQTKWREFVERKPQFVQPGV